MRPKRIILVRHGESEGNVNFDLYASKPDHKLVLTPKGIEQAKNVGVKLEDLWGPVPTHIWASPYARTRLTAKHLTAAFDQSLIYRGEIFEDPRIREQERGNYRKQPLINELESQRDNYGTFFYRFPEGESGADVYDRVTGFLDSIFRDFAKTDYNVTNLIVVTHGLTMRLFLMRFFHKSVEWFESLKNPHNCQYAVLERPEDSPKYALTVPLDFKRPGDREPPPNAE